MAVESADWVTQLVSTNPVVGDPVGEGDDHLRMIKTVLKNSFPSTSTTAIVPNVSGQSGKYLTNDGTDSSWGTITPADTTGLEDDIALLGFKVASNGSLAKYNLVDQTIDDFQDTSGVDASASTNETRDASGKYYSGSAGGSITPAAFTYTGSVQNYTVPAGISTVTFSCWGAGGGQASGAGNAGAGGYVKGTITVTAADVLKLVVGGAGTGGSEGSGGGGLSGVFFPTELDASYPAYARIIGGGGGGGGRGDGAAPNGGAGGGTAGEDVSGAASGYGEGGDQSAGGGSGGAQFAAGSNGGSYGGYGGGGGGSDSGWGGSGGGGGWYGGGAGQSGVDSHGDAGGGGSGYYNPSNVASQTLEAGSGTTPGGVSDPNYSTSYGGPTENGYIYLSAGTTSYLDMTLVSTTTAAQAAPTKGDIVLTYTNGAGTTTLDTDLTAEISADGGSTWTALALASEGSTGAHNIATSHNVTISSTITAPYNMAYRIKTLNQSASKITRIQAVSLGWS